MPSSGITVNPDCVTKFNELKLGRGSLKYIIYKITDDAKEIVVDDSGSETDYEVFREKLIGKKDSKGKTRPSYAVYDVDYEIKDEGKRSKILFIQYIDSESAIKSRMVYASSKDALKNAFNGIAETKEASDASELEYGEILDAASKGKAIKP